MMMTILTPAARGARLRGRVRLIILAAAVGLSGGAWAATRSPPSYALRVVDVRTGQVVTRARTDGALKALAHGMADGISVVAAAGTPPERAQVREILLAGGPALAEADGLKIEIIDGWAMPGLSMVMPPSQPFEEE